VAGLKQAPGNQLQLRLVAWLRWRLFVNGLRTRRGKAELATKIILGALTGVAALAFGLALGVGSWYAIHLHKPFILSVELWVIFLAWLVWPLLISGYGAESDTASLLRFPIRYPSFVVLTLSYGILDPTAVVALLWLAAMLTGIGFASAGALLRATPAMLVFAALNLLLNRTIFAWLSRWLAQRRTREILGVIFIFLMFSFQLVGPLAQRYGKRAYSAVAPLGAASRVLPPGLTATIITAGDGGRALGAVAGLLVYCGVLAGLLSVRLNAEYRGENLSEARRPAPEQPSTLRPGWNIAGLSPTVAALLEKDLHYLRRNTMAYFSLLAPPFIVIVMSLNRGLARPRHTMFWQSSSFMFPISVGYVMLVLAGFLYNSLGFDGPGLPMLMAAPIRFRDVLAAKNLLYSMVFLAEILAVFVLVQWITGPTPPLVVAVTLAGALWALLTNLTAGNLVSLYFPQRLNLGEMRRQRASGLAMSANFGIQLVLASVAAGLYFLARWAGNLAWCGIAFVALAGIAGMAYRYVLNLVSGIAWKRREALMAALSRAG
jgi:ABC-2 type transport system permease protein